MGAYEDQPNILRKIANLARRLSALERTQDQIPAGTIVATGRATAPPGWLMCDGSVVSRSEYGGLFAAIGTRYGAGDGSTTFALPDLNNGRFPRGNHASGATGGASSHAHSMDHTHSGTTGTTGSVNLAAVPGFEEPSVTVAEASHVHGFTTGGPSSALTGSASSLPPYVDVNYMIKT